MPNRRSTRLLEYRLMAASYVATASWYCPCANWQRINSLDHRSFQMPLSTSSCAILVASSKSPLRKSNSAVSRSAAKTRPPPPAPPQVDAIRDKITSDVRRKRDRCCIGGRLRQNRWEHGTRTGHADQDRTR